MKTRYLAALATLSFTTTVHAATVAGLWEFDNELDLGHATVGTDMVFFGSAPGTWSASLADDFGTPLSGVITTPGGGPENIFVTYNNIPANGGGLYVNEWSFLMDIHSPIGSRNSWRALFQTNPANANDTDYVIHPVDDSLGIGAIGYSDNPLLPIDETLWTRLVVTFSIPLSGQATIKSYLNGSFLFDHTHLFDGSDGRFAIESTFLFFSDDDGENAPLNVGTLALFDGALSAAEVTALGAAGAVVPEPGSAALLLAGCAAFLRRRR